MEYTIVTSHPNDLRTEIIECIKDGKDNNGSDIDTWEVTEVTLKNSKGETHKEEVLVHNTSAWANVGFIRLMSDKNGNTKLHASFVYRHKFPAEDQDGTHELYLYGRLSELLLVHFMDSIRTIIIKNE